MTSDAPQYELGSEELTFIRTVTQEFLFMQMMRQILHDRYSETEIKELVAELQREAEDFNQNLNNDNEPQSIAWKERMSRDFSRFYRAIAADKETWEGEYDASK